MSTQQQWAQNIRSLGWFLCLIPPVGWLMALGFRKSVALTLLHPDSYPLSPQNFTWIDYLRFLRDGFCALGVMSLYFMPTLGLSWYLGSAQSHMNWAEICLGFIKYAAASLSFPPITLGSVNLYYQLSIPGFHLSLAKGSLIIISMLLTTFVLPLGYMQIGKRGKWLDTFNLWQVFNTFLNNPKGYLLAWRDSIRLTLAALSLGIHTPWGIIWSYQGIVWLFNQLQAEHFPSHSFNSNLVDSSSPTSYSLNKYPNCISRLGVPVPIWWRGDQID